MLKIHKQVLAKKDFKGMLLYSIKRWGEKHADQYYDEVSNSINLIASNPEIGITCDEIKMGYRCFKIKEYYVFYKITKTRIVIIRVLHESMKPSLHFK